MSNDNDSTNDSNETGIDSLGIFNDSGAGFTFNDEVLEEGQRWRRQGLTLDHVISHGQ